MAPRKTKRTVKRTKRKAPKKESGPKVSAADAATLVKLTSAEAEAVLGGASYEAMKATLASLRAIMPSSIDREFRYFCRVAAKADKFKSCESDKTLMFATFLKNIGQLTPVLTEISKRPQVFSVGIKEKAPVSRVSSGAAALIGAAGANVSLQCMLKAPTADVKKRLKLVSGLSDKDLKGLSHIQLCQVIQGLQSPQKARAILGLKADDPLVDIDVKEAAKKMSPLEKRVAAYEKKRDAPKRSAGFTQLFPGAAVDASPAPAAAAPQSTLNRFLFGAN